MVNTNNSPKTTRNRYIFAAVFAAMIAVSNFFQVPLPGGVPIVLKNMFVVLSGTVLGSYYGGIAVLILIGAGLIGIPVFVIPGGPGVFLTPLGGYIIGYFAASLCAGLVCGLPQVSEKKMRPIFLLRLSLASLLGFSLILFCGAFYMMRLNSLSFTAAMIAGVVPYIYGDLVKLALSIPLALKLRPIAARYLN
ncbi:MAG: biotin transporter BioY [Treponema sp.]|jgi:biotin transport system substrate-specific component|nr:biotin transporter BioY [Treponema sp.]